MDLASFAMMNLLLRIGERTTDNLTTDMLCISVIPATMPLGGYMQDPSSHAPSVNFAKAIEAFHPHILFIAIS
jgi:hypothetical protein